jgi:broad specificity phosphatase PhoE
MAALAATSLAGRPIVALAASPLQRTQESAAPWTRQFGLEARLDERLIEPVNRFEGLNLRRELRNPRHWPFLMNPSRPSWGEPFGSIAERMLAAVASAHAGVEGGEVVMVSHQLPIWMVARRVAGRALPHDPRRRRCTLSSITTFGWIDGVMVEVDYQEPAAELLAESIDLGAV